jgi:23S rRNA pseudouridine1911/1915/1917 synthase
MVVAKNDATHRALSAAWGTDAVRKEYLAIVYGAPKKAKGTIDAAIGRDPRNRKRMAVVARNGKTAVTNWRRLPLACAPGVAAVECRIETGRTHQIRVHMASLGAPVVGDAVYGRRALDKRLDPVPARQMLHAYRLALRHPVTREDLVLTAPVPADMRVYLPAAAL